MLTKGGHNLGQNNYHTITFFFFSKKNNFHGHFQRKNSFQFTSLVLKGHMQTVVLLILEE